MSAKTGRPQLHDRTILIVDDNADNRFVMSRWLRRHGAEVLEAETAREGLDLIRSGPDAVILDVRLGDASGLDVARQIKSDPLTRTIPILQRSSVAVAETDQILGLEAGADTYLIEPISEPMLVGVLASLLRFSDAQRQLEFALSLDVTGVFDVSVRTGEVKWSESVERILRMSPGSLGTTVDSWLDAVHPSDRSRVREALDVEQATMTDSIQVRHRVVRADESVGWVDVRGAILRAGGTATRIQGVVIDVTARERSRQRIDDLRRLGERLSREVGSREVFAAGAVAMARTGLGLEILDRGAPTLDDELGRFDVGDEGVVVVGRGRQSDVDHGLVIGRQVAIAYDRARRQEDEARTAEFLRQALLPDDMPIVDGVEIDVFHAAADAHERIGGDFHDAILIGRELVVILGDVVGHGLQATHQMSTVRAMLRTLVSERGARAAEVLASANGIFTRVCGRDSPFVTAMVLTLDIETGAVRVASAGHPAPIVHCDGDASRLAVEPGPPLGVVPQAEYSESVADLGVGDWVAVFTDGVFERRDEVIDDVIDVVMPRLDEHATAGGLARAAAATLVEARPTDDDRAVVLVRRIDDAPDDRT